MHTILPPLLILSSSLMLLLLCLATTNAEVPRPRGVSLAKASLYYPGDDHKWVCLDGSKSIDATQINDDFCDCADGSDEPGTAACAQSLFHCANVGHTAVDIPSSRVNDGVCDCCDTSDEYELVAKCENTCKRLGLEEQEHKKNRAELHKRGSAKRSELIAKGNQLKAERETRRAELERRRQEQETLKVEKEELKRIAEAAESEALELYKQEQSEQEAKHAENAEAEGLPAEAHASFIAYDTNKDGFVEVTELQVDMRLDRNRDGAVTIEEAKYFLDERERIDLEEFMTLSWPRIKTIQMLAVGLFKPPTSDGESGGNIEGAELENDPARQPEIVGTETNNAERYHDAGEEEDEEPTYDDEEMEEEEDVDADVGVGSVTAEGSTPAPEYDPETQRLIELANNARSAHADVVRELNEIDSEIKEIDDQTAKDYGPNEEYAAMDGECFKFEDREYVYTLCPFDRAAQKQRSGGSETTLGRWDQWVTEDGYKYAKQKYAHGASCWNGPQRSAIVQLKCALESRITGVSEPNRCEYFFEFETPAACDSATDAEPNTHDEL